MNLAAFIYVFQRNKTVILQIIQLIWQHSSNWTEKKDMFSMQVHVHVASLRAYEQMTYWSNKMKTHWPLFDRIAVKCFTWCHISICQWQVQDQALYTMATQIWTMLLQLMESATELVQVSSMTSCKCSWQWPILLVIKWSGGMIR